MRKNVLIIYPQLESPLSGGQVIDFIFIDQLNEATKFKCKYLLDKNIQGKSIISFIKHTILNLKYIRNNDIIFTNSRMYTRLLPCILLLKLQRTKIRIMCYHHHYNYMTHTGIFKIIHFLIEIVFLRFFDDVIIPSPYVLSMSKNILCKDSLKYIEIGFKKLDNVGKSNQHIFRGNLLFVGTVEKRKNIHHLVELARYLAGKGTNFKINIVGRSPDEKYCNLIKGMIEKYGLENDVKLLGRVSSEELGDLYKDSDIFVFPSSHEGYGMVLIEAMSYGLPAVVYNNSAMPFTVVHDYNGLLASNGCISDICNKTYELLVNVSLYNKLRSGALETAQKANSYDLMVTHMNTFIKTV